MCLCRCRRHHSIARGKTKGSDIVENLIQFICCSFCSRIVCWFSPILPLRMFTPLSMASSGSVHVYQLEFVSFWWAHVACLCVLYASNTNSVRFNRLSASHRAHLFNELMLCSVSVRDLISHSFPNPNRSSEWGKQIANIANSIK